MLSVVSRGHEMRSALRGKLRVPPLKERGEPAEDALEFVALGAKPLHLRLERQEAALRPRVGDEAGHSQRLARRHAPGREHDAQDTREEQTERQPEQPDPWIVEHVDQCTDSPREVKELREA
jgi:hypothetical protein